MQTFSSPGFEPVVTRILTTETAYIMSVTDTIVEVALIDPALVTIILPLVVGLPIGKIYTVTDANNIASIYNITIESNINLALDPPSGPLIGGESSYIIDNNGGSVNFYFDGTNFVICGNNAISSLGFYNYLDYPGATSGFTDQTTTIQNFLLWCQLQALKLSTITQDGLIQRYFVNAYIPRGRYEVSCPIIVPEFVNLWCDGEIQRTAPSAGPSTLKFYTGDTTSKALANRFLPTLIFVPRSSCSNNCNVQCDPGGAAGSGVIGGKNWTAQSVAVSNPGTAYQVGNILTFAQPSLNYYVAIQVTVASVNTSGGILTVTLTTAGAYALPPVLQALQWTAANGFTGAIANGTPGQVFDSNGAFITSGGTGKGATFMVTWTPDWSNGSTLYNTGAFLVQDILIGNLRVNGVGNSFDSTFGPMYGVWMSSGNYEFNHVQTVGGSIGIYIRGASDIRGDTLNAVDAQTNMVVFAMGSFECQNVVLDTCTANTFFAIDQCEGAILKIHCLMPPATGGTLAGGFIGKIGASSSGAGAANQGLDIEINTSNCGTVAGVPMLSLAHTYGSKVKAYASNYAQGGVANLNLMSSLATFGTGWDVSNLVEGLCDGMTGNLFNGTVPSCGINVRDTAANGWAGDNNIYRISGSGAPTNGTTGAGKANIGSQYTDYTGGALYINTGTQASPTWTQLT